MTDFGPTYPGNSALEEDVRERILETYEHALSVAATGGLEEARLGCDFISRLDPEFRPAKVLAQRLEGAVGPVDVSDLALGAAPATAPAAGLEAAAAIDPASLVTEFQSLLAGRSFQELAARAQEESAAIASDPSLQQILGQAQERMEAAPYVESFLQQAGTALEGGDAVSAAGLLEKARALDPTHPDLDTLQKLLQAGGAAPDAPPAVADPLDETSPSFTLDGEIEPPDELEAGLESFDAPELESLDEFDDGTYALDEDLALDTDTPLATDLSLDPSLNPDAATSADADAGFDLGGGFDLEAEDDVAPTVGLTAPGPDETSFGDLGDGMGGDLSASFDETAGTSESADSITGPLEFEAADDELEELPALEAEPFEPVEGEVEALAELDDDLALDGFDQLPELEPIEEPAAPAASASGPSDPDPRIAELLDEGQAAYERQEFQDAIDAWSRIFLIDIDHQEAAQRIDRARGQKAEEERQVESAFHDGQAALEGGDLAAAEAAFRRVLELQPNHAEAGEFVARFDAGEGESLLADEELPELPVAAAEPVADAPVGAAPAEAAAAPKSAPPPVAPPKPAGRGRFLTIAAVVALLVLAGGGFLWMKWSSFFPNTVEIVEPDVPEVTPIERATAQYDEGKRSAAIAQLKRLPPASPYYQEGQTLIAQWEAEAAAEAGPTEAQLVERQGLIDRARLLNQQQRYWESIPLLDRASMIAPLEGEDARERQTAATALEPFQGQITLLREAEYDRALRDLWLAREEDPSNSVANHLLLASYFNLGVRGLQQGRVDSALESFEEASRLAPEDEDIQRHLAFARSYERRSQDLLFRIYAKHLTPRPI